MEEETRSAASFLLPRGSTAAWSTEPQCYGNMTLIDIVAIAYSGAIHGAPQSPLSPPDLLSCAGGLLGSDGTMAHDMREQDVPQRK